MDKLLKKHKLDEEKLFQEEVTEKCRFTENG
jgi:hypothetical protein